MKLTIIMSILTLLSWPTLAQNACVDSDGDGWGWNGVSSCQVSNASTNTNTSVSNNTSTATNTSSNTCVDDDGDGWGWNGVSSCQVSNASTNTNTSVSNNTSTATNTSSNTCVDDDGDGWGWNGVSSCQVQSPQSNNTESLVINNANCSALNNKDLRNSVTDVILTAGQSNAAGGNTKYDPNNSDDRVNSRVIVWTTNNRWEIPDPRSQTWHTYTNDRGETSRYPRNTNHPALQIGNSVAKTNPCKVVAIIATAAPGQPIRIWNNNVNNYFSNIDNKVRNALNKLPGKNNVDMIWWMQGEADNDPDIYRYFGKVNNLMSKFHALPWYGPARYFLANETGWYPFVNNALALLRTDNNPNTDFSRGEDTTSDPFPHISSEPRKVHFNEVALRKIGRLVSDKYTNEYQSGN